MTKQIKTTNKVIAEFPAYKYLEAAKNRDDHVEVFHDSEFAIAFETRNHGTLHRHFKFGTVVSYVLGYNEDPIAAYKSAIELDQQTHWANSLGACITSSKQAQVDVVVLEWGETVKLEGKVFRLEKAANNNIWMAVV